MEIDTLTPEQYQGLSRVRQQQYAERLILKLIQDAGPEGIIQTEIRKKSPFAISTISKYVDILLAKRQIFKIAKGNVIILHANGIPLHEIVHKDVQIAKKTYGIALIENGHGREIYIQEYETDEIGMKRLAGGIVIEAGATTQLVSAIEQVSKDTARLYD